MRIPALQFIKKNGAIYFRPVGGAGINMFGANLNHVYLISGIVHYKSSFEYEHNFELLFNAYFCNSARIFLSGYHNVNFKLHHGLRTINAELSLDFYATKITISKELVKKIEIPIYEGIVKHNEILTMNCYPVVSVMNEFLD